MPMAIKPRSAKPRSAEEWLAQVDEVIRAYRAADPRQLQLGPRQEAIDRLRMLGLSEGEAIRYLNAKKPKV
jgi:hypothetical protein